MNITELAECTSCGFVFRIKDGKDKKVQKLYGMEIRTCGCPKCGGSFRMMYIPRWMDQYLYNNSDKRYF